MSVTAWRWVAAIVLLEVIVLLAVCQSGVAHAQEAEPVYAEVRLTYYNLPGLTFSGERVRYGGTACSWNFAIGQRFRLPNGEDFTCNDRGRLGWSGWLDLWNRSDLARAYGSYVTVEVLE